MSIQVAALAWLKRRLAQQGLSLHLLSIVSKPASACFGLIVAFNLKPAFLDALRVLPGWKPAFISH